MLKTQTEIFRGYGKVGELSGQTAVECRFGGEVETVLAAHADVVLTNAEADNGEVKYFGKVRFLIVYEDGEKRVCRAEKGVEFSAKAQGEECCPAYTVRARAAVENVSLRREGASVYATALIGTDILLYGETSFEYLTDGDLVLKREKMPVHTAHLCNASTQTDDEFETECLGDVLLHAETASVSQITCDVGFMRLEGEINLGLLALKGENSLASFERLVPFQLEIPCESASYGCCGEANVKVSGVSVHVDSDEEKGRSRVNVEFTIDAEGCVYEQTEIEAVTDAFSATNVVTLSFGEMKSEGAGELMRITERVSGKAALSGKVDFSDSLQAVILQRAEANLTLSKEGARVEGVAAATLLVQGSDGARRGIEMSLPFSVPVQTEGECSAKVLVCSASARQRQEGEIDAEATLKIILQEKKKLSGRQVTSVVEGESFPETDCAVSVYIPRAGDGLWELAKSLKKPPEVVSESNPDVEFPIKEGQRIIIYRKKSLSV